MARACAAGVAISLAMSLFAPALAQGAPEEIVRPDIFRASATALGASVMADREGLLPIPEAFRFIALDGEGTYETANQEARASIFFPGNGVIRAPSLFCGTFADQFPPEFTGVFEACTQARYPLTVFADSLNPEGTSVGSLALGDSGDPVSGNAVRAAAVAHIEATTTDAAMNDFRVVGLATYGPSGPLLPVPGLPEVDATVLSVDSMVARTDQRIDEAGRLIVDATSTLQGVRLAGGLVEIGSIRSRSLVIDDGEGAKEHEASLEVSGVTAGGVPAQITDDGLVIGSPGGSGPLTDQLVRAVNQLLDGMGVRISTLEVDDGVDEAGIAFARSGGVLVEFAFEVRGLPAVPGPFGEIDLSGLYEGTMVLGATGATGIAAAIPPFEIDVVAPPPLPADLGGSPVPGDFGAPSVTGSPAPAPVASGPVAARTGPTGQDTPVRWVSVLDLLEADLRWLYLAFTLSGLGLAVSPRFSLPARLPRSTT